MDKDMDDFSFLDGLAGLFEDGASEDSIHRTPSLEHRTPSFDLFRGNTHRRSSFDLQVSEVHWNDEITVDDLGDLVLPEGVTVTKTINEEEAPPPRVVVEQPKRKAAVARTNNNAEDTRAKKKARFAGVQMNTINEIPYAFLVENGKTFCTPASSYSFNRLDDRAILRKMCGEVDVNIKEVTCQMCKGVACCQCTFFGLVGLYHLKW